MLANRKRNKQQVKRAPHTFFKNGGEEMRGVVCKVQHCTFVFVYHAE